MEMIVKCLYLFPVVCGIVLAGLLACPADEKADNAMGGGMPPGGGMY